MKVLVIGSGGREHAIAHALHKSSKVTEIHAIPGNPGIATIGTCHSGSVEDVVQEVADCIGSGPAISETVPAALAILIANQGKTMESIYDAVNIGDETCAIACIVGAIAGTLNGVESIPEEYLDFIEKTNGIDLKKQAEEIEKLW